MQYKCWRNEREITEKTAGLFRPLSGNFIEMNYELVLLANMIGRNYFEKESGIYYSDMELKNYNFRRGQSRRLGFIKRSRNRKQTSEKRFPTPQIL
ncbi:hypothetical protein C0T31_09520 [Dysgonamonadaceae bacterium]|nr:hypothetical protein C0T31_09520 [Dysgonamonadaceae bacterium]